MTQRRRSLEDIRIVSLSASEKGLDKNFPASTEKKKNTTPNSYLETADNQSDVKSTWLLMMTVNSVALAMIFIF